jgi:ABC-2 type transport system permease protein
VKTQRFFAAFVARNQEFLRDRAALSWNFLFPALIVVGFSFLFSEHSVDQYKVAVTGDLHQAQQAGMSFLKTKYIQFIPVKDQQAAVTKVRRHQLDMLLDVAGHRYWINERSPRGYMLERVLRGSGSNDFTRAVVSGRQIRYVDWLLPGVLSMNMMFSALFGVGYVIVRYRKNGVLKRLKATPMTAFEFLAAQVVSRLWLILVTGVLVYVGTDMVLDFAMFGSYLDLFILFALGAVSVISLGLLVAARIASEELANGVLNLISWPMMFLSEVWFSLEGAQPFMKKLALIFPLTHLTAGARAIMIDGASLVDIAPHVITLVGTSLLFLALGSYWFRWE